MGIHGLLQFTKEASRESHLSELHGSCVAIDAYCWLHKGCFSCPEQLVKGEKTTKYINYSMMMIKLLLQNNVKPILVFDGLPLPSKKETEKKREENRQKYKKLGRQYLREGKLKEARDCFTKCVNVTSLMALELIKACRKIGVDCIVAPYEADAQLAYLNKQGIAQTVITEDSDLILFGCDRILYKLDRTGRGILLEKDKLPMCSSLNRHKYTFENFRRMCILSGCDYLTSLHGIGLGKACKFFSKISTNNMKMMLKKLPSYLKMQHLSVTEEYIDGFLKAEYTFLYQLAFCPEKRKLVPLNPYQDGIDFQNLGYAGSYFSDDKAFQIALGNIDVNTLQTIDDFNPDAFSIQSANRGDCIKSSSIWSKNFSKSSINFEDEIKNSNTKDKVVTLSLDFGKKQSPKKKRTSLKRPIDDDDSICNNELENIYSHKSKKEAVETPGSFQMRSPKKERLTNPFKVSKKSPSPKKKVISRFFKSASPVKTSEPKEISAEKSDSKNCNKSQNFQWTVTEISQSPPIFITNLPSSQQSFKSPKMMDISECSPASSQENYEPLPDSQLTVCSIDSMSMSQNSDVSFLCGLESTDKDNEQKNTPDISFVGNSTKNHVLPFAAKKKKNASPKRTTRRPGLSKVKSKSSDTKIQLSIKESLEKFKFNKIKGTNL